MEREVIQLATFLPLLKSGPYSEQQVNCLAGPTQQILKTLCSEWCQAHTVTVDCCAELLTATRGVGGDKNLGEEQRPHVQAHLLSSLPPLALVRLQCKHWAVKCISSS